MEEREKESDEGKCKICRYKFCIFVVGGVIILRVENNFVLWIIMILMGKNIERERDEEKCNCRRKLCVFAVAGVLILHV